MLDSAASRPAESPSVAGTLRSVQMCIELKKITSQWAPNCMCRAIQPLMSIQHSHCIASWTLNSLFCVAIDDECTSPDKTDSSTRQLPVRRTMSQVAFPLSRTTTSPGTSLRDDTPLQPPHNFSSLSTTQRSQKQQKSGRQERWA